MSELISAEARSWIGREGEPVHVEVNRSDIIKYSISTEQQQEKFLNGDEAPAMFLFGALRPIAPLAELGSDGLPKDSFLPDLPLKRVMAGGNTVRYHRPVRPGDVLVGTLRLADIFEKQGSSGPLIFVVYEMKVENENGEPVMDETQTRIVR